MTFFKKYKNNKIGINKYTEIENKKTEEDSLVDKNEDSSSVSDAKIEEIKQMIEKTKKHVVDEILETEFKSDPFFDDELYKSLDTLHNYISSFIPNYPLYYDKEGNINPQAYIDARNFLINELPVSVDEILYSDDTYSGVMNDTKINFDNGFSVDSTGNVFNSDRELVLSTHNPGQLIKYIDFINKKVVTETGVRIDLPDKFIEEYVEDEDFISMYEKKMQQIKIQNNSNTDNNSIAHNKKKFLSTNDKYDKFKKDNIYGMANGVPIYESEKDLVHLDVENLYLGDIFPDMELDKPIDFIKQLKDVNKNYKTLGICNFKDIPYGELNSLLFWGGGERGVKPLSGTTISSKDIVFKQDGTVLYSGQNSTIKTHRAGCRSKTYKTGHVCMYSESNKIGLKRGIIQYIYSFCNMFGVFNANVPPLIGYKHCKIFPGLCIGGLLEMFLCKWQEKLSSRINELFQCIPAKMTSDLSQSGFENETFPYGCSVDNIEELDNIKSCKVGDRFIVNFVPTSITGNLRPACGVFIYDPEDRFSMLYSWKYKDFRGKPFKEKDSNVTVSSENMYDNPIIKDILMNTNALGEDGITRKLMALQYAFLKKEALLALQDIDNSMESLIDVSIEQVMDNLPFQISNFLEMQNYHLKCVTNSNSTKTKKSFSNTTQENPEKKYKYVSKFLDHFNYLVVNGKLKSIPLEKCERIKEISSDSSSAKMYIKYYDFTGYNKEEYLVPAIKNVELYDCMMFSEMFIPKNDFQSVIDDNLKYYEALGAKVTKFKNAKTIKEMIRVMTDDKDGYNLMIENDLKYLEREMAYNGYDDAAFQQMKKRCYYAIENSNIFGRKK